MPTYDMTGIDITNLSSLNGAAVGGGGVNLTSATTAPASPSAGDQWFDTANGILYAYMTDGTDSQWLDISSANGVAAASTGGGAMELISTQTVSSSVASVDFTGLSGYDTYKVICKLSLSSYSVLKLKIYDNTVLFTGRIDNETNYNGITTMDNDVGYCKLSQSSFIDYYIEATLNFMSSGTDFLVVSTCSYPGGSPEYIANSASTDRTLDAMTSLTGFQVLTGTAETIDSGTISLYGIKS